MRTILTAAGITLIVVAALLHGTGSKWWEVFMALAILCALLK